MVNGIKVGEHFNRIEWLSRNNEDEGECRVKDLIVLTKRVFATLSISFINLFVNAELSFNKSLVFKTFVVLFITSECPEVVELNQVRR